jgi:hypothetical protein
MSTNNTVSLKQIARIAGVLYIVIIVAGMFGGSCYALGRRF